MLLMEETFERVKCEDLEKIVVGDDLEKFFLSRSSATSLREGKADRVSQKEP